MTDIAAKNEEPTITVGDKTHKLSELSPEVQELLGLHEQATQMMLTAKRQAIINEMSVVRIAGLIEKALDETND